jgi:hypothetical protein
MRPLPTGRPTTRRMIRRTRVAELVMSAVTVAKENAK